VDLMAAFRQLGAKFGREHPGTPGDRVAGDGDFQGTGHGWAIVGGG